MNTNTPLIERFKDYFKLLHEADLSRLQALYSDQVIFKDPSMKFAAWLSWKIISPRCVRI